MFRPQTFHRAAIGMGLTRCILSTVKSHAYQVNHICKLIEKWGTCKFTSEQAALLCTLEEENNLKEFLAFEDCMLKIDENNEGNEKSNKISAASSTFGIRLRRIRQLTENMQKTLDIIDHWKAVDLSSDHSLIAFTELFMRGLPEVVQNYEDAVLEPAAKLVKYSKINLKGEWEQSADPLCSVNSFMQVLMRKLETEANCGEFELDNADRLFKRYLASMEEKHKNSEEYYKDSHQDRAKFGGDENVNDMKNIREEKNKVTENESFVDCKEKVELEVKSDENVGPLVDGESRDTEQDDDVSPFLSNFYGERTDLLAQVIIAEKEWKKPKNPIRREAINSQKVKDAIQLLETLTLPNVKREVESPMVGKEKIELIVESTTEHATAHTIDMKTKKKQRKQKQKEVKDEKDIEDYIAMAEAVEENCEETDKETRHLYEGLLRMYTDRTKEMPKELSRTLAKKYMDVRMNELMAVVEKLGNEDSGELKAEGEEEENSSWWEMRKRKNQYDRYVQLSQMELSDDTIAEICFLQSEKKNEAFVYLEEIFIQKFSD